jgi:hypothetical protein
MCESILATTSSGIRFGLLACLPRPSGETTAPLAHTRAFSNLTCNEDQYITICAECTCSVSSDLLRSNTQDGNEAVEAYTMPCSSDFEVICGREQPLLSPSDLQSLALEFDTMQIDQASEIGLLLCAIQRLKDGSNGLPALPTDAMEAFQRAATWTFLTHGLFDSIVPFPLRCDSRYDRKHPSQCSSRSIVMDSPNTTKIDKCYLSWIRHTTFGR